MIEDRIRLKIELKFKQYIKEVIYFDHQNILGNYISLFEKVFNEYEIIVVDTNWEVNKAKFKDFIEEKVICNYFEYRPKDSFVYMNIQISNEDYVGYFYAKFKYSKRILYIYDLKF